MKNPFLRCEMNMNDFNIIVDIFMQSQHREWAWAFNY